MKIHSRTSFLHALGALGLLLVHAPAQAQITLNQNASPAYFVQAQLMGPGVTVSDVRFNGVPGNNTLPIGHGPSEMGRFNGSNTCLGINEGIFLCTGVATVHIPGPNDRLDANGGGIGAPTGISTPDLDLSLLTGYPYWQETGGGNIYNKANLEFDLVPDNDMISFRYVFSSEEYERWACSEYNDPFGFFLSGPGITGPFQNNAINIAFVPGSLSPITINNVNNGLTSTNNANGPWTDPFLYCDQNPDWQANAQYYRYNGGQWSFPQPPDGPQLEAPYNTDPYYIQHNGMTVVLTATAAVSIADTFHIKLGLGNAMDSKYPSAVFIERESFRSSDRFTLTVDEGPNVEVIGDVVTLHESDVDSAYLRFNRWGGFYLDEPLRIAVEGDAIPGVDYSPALPDTLHFDQLDSAVVVPLAIPVLSGEPRELIVHLITSNGNKVQTFHFLIDEQLTVDVNGAGARDPLSVLLDPGTNRLRVTLPRSMQRRAELQVSDMAGRIVMRQAASGTADATMELGRLPDGLYSVIARTGDQAATARVIVRH